MKYVFLLLFLPKIVCAELCDIIHDTERKYDLPRGIIDAMVAVESSGVNRVTASDGTKKQRAAGKKIPSFGLLQVQLAAAREVGFRGKVGELMVPRVNIEIGARYLKKFYLKYNKDLARALTCYNSGPYSEPCLRGRYTHHVGKVLNAWVK